MPRVTPSSIVRAIDQSYPALADGSHFTAGLDSTHAATVGSLVSLTDRLSDGHFAALSQEDYVDLLRTLEMLRDIVEHWRIPAATGYQRLLGPTPVLQGRHPLAVLRAILTRCLEEPEHPHSSGLPFIDDVGLREVLQQDVSTAWRALANGEFKAAAVMAGSVIESLLLWALQRLEPTATSAAVEGWLRQAEAEGRRAARPAQDITKWSLEQYNGVALVAGITTTSISRSISLAQDFRNLIHPGPSGKNATEEHAGYGNSCCGCSSAAH